MTISAERQKIIDRVTKLMALADNSSFSEEADTARNMAIELMAKHQLTHSDMSIEDTELTVEIEDTENKKKDTSAINLIHAVAAFCGVAMVVSGSSTERGSIKYKFIGTKNDIEAFRYTLAIIYNQRDYAWKQSGKRGSNVMYHWRMGYSFGVSAKLFTLMKATDAKVQEWGLVPVSAHKKAMDWYKSEHNVTSGRVSSVHSLDQSAYNAGKSVSITKGLGAATLSIGR